MAAAEAGGREDTCYGLADSERFVDFEFRGEFSPQLAATLRSDYVRNGSTLAGEGQGRRAAAKGDRFSSGRHRRQDFGRAAFRLAKGLDRSPERQRVCATRHEPTRMNATVVIPCN